MCLESYGWAVTFRSLNKILKYIFSFINLSLQPGGQGPRQPAGGASLIFRGEVNYFLLMVDNAIMSLESRFEKVQSFKDIFGFLMSSTILNSQRMVLN